jgi:hypothetical protein
VTVLKFELTERHLKNPKPTYSFVIHRPGDEMTLSEEYAHTVLLFRPGGSSGGGSSGIIVDPSHAQYHFEHGIDTIDGYIESKTGPTDMLDPFDSFHRDELFGDTMMEEKSKDNDTQSSWLHHMNAEIIGVTNNTIIAEVERLEGVSALLSLSDQFFENALHRLTASLDFELVELRQRLEVVLYNTDDDLDSFKFFREILDGEGHRLCGESLERVILQLKTLPKYKIVSAPDAL